MSFDRKKGNDNASSAAEPYGYRRSEPAVPASTPESQAAHQAWCHEKLVQLLAESIPGRAAAAAPASVLEAADRGTASPTTTMPHAAPIQRAFGDHDLSGVQAHVGGAAADACADMGATAFASGNHVAFAQSPDLHTAAHEAAHVVQQRAGVQLYGGVGAAGDAYEQQADAVADRVVAGQSAADLLGPVGPASALASQQTPPNVQQRKGEEDEEGYKATKAKWKWKRQMASEHRNHEYGSKETLAVGDKLEITAKPQSKQAEVNSTYEGTPGAVAYLANSHWEDDEYKILWTAQMPGEGMIVSTAADPGKMPSMHVHPVQVISTVDHQRTRLMRSQGEILSRYFAAEAWLSQSGANYAQAHENHSDTLKAASQSSDSLLGELLWAAVTSATGLGVKALLGKILSATAKVGEAAQETIGEIGKDTVGGVPKPGGGDEYAAVGQDPFQAFAGARAVLNRQYKQLQEVQNGMVGEVDWQEKSGRGDKAEFKSDPMVVLQEKAVVAAEIVGQLESTQAPSVQDFERSLWKVWLQEYGWKVAADGTRERRVRNAESEYTEVTHKYKAVENVPSAVRDRIRQVVPEAKDFLEDNAAVAEGEARRDAKSAERVEHTNVRRF